MNDPIEKRLQKNKEDGFIIDSNDLRVEMCAGRVISWSNFRTKDLFFDMSNSEIGKSGLVSLNNGFIKGDLHVFGAGVDVRNFEVNNCEVDGKIVFDSVRIGNIKIVGKSSFLDFNKVDFGEIYGCGEFRKGIIMNRLKGNSVEINGYTDEVFLDELKLEKLKFLTFECNLIEGWNLQVTEADLPFSQKVLLDNVSIEHLNMIEKSEVVGSIYNLKNANLNL